MPVRIALLVLATVAIAGCSSTAPVVEPPPPPPPPPPAAEEPPPPIGPFVDASRARNAQVSSAVTSLLARCRAADCGLPIKRSVDVEGVTVEGDAVVVRLSRDLGDTPVRPAGAAAFQAEVERVARAIYPNRPIRVETRGATIQDLVPNFARDESDQDPDRLFAPAVGTPPLVQRVGGRLPTAGLAGRHVALWPSHGWLYNPRANAWGWQRATLFTTVEDLLTVQLVTRQLAPMLERAGAVTLLPRERDVRQREVIVDDGDPGFRGATDWDMGPAGFGRRDSYGDGVNPFTLGTTREAPGYDADAVYAIWEPDLPEAGAYAVHVSYASGPNRPEAATYLVNHAGGQSRVLVNQTIGAGTWVYIGTYEFEAGTGGSVWLAHDDSRTLASADAVRFGGGVGIVQREGQTSGRPRWTEAARYYEQFAGAPRQVYNVTGEPDEDYVDDYRSRGEWVNWLRGAPFGPNGQRDLPGLGIPVDLALGWHTDAGIQRRGIVGTLAIYDVPGMDASRVFPNGVSRLANRDLADLVQTEIVDDVRQLYEPDWRRRPLWDRNYSEAARPNVPSLLLELLSHQNFYDMRFGLDPRVQFDAARAVYKGIGRFLADQRGEAFIPQPLRPTLLSAERSGDAIELRWRPQPDPLEPDARPASYRVEARDGAWGWRTVAERVEATELRLAVSSGDDVRSVRVVAENAGGASRPSAVLAVRSAPREAPLALVIDGFDRVSAPESIDQGNRAGFVEPVGVSEGLDVTTIGEQFNFDPNDDYENDARPGWGHSRLDLAFTPILGNTRDHVAPIARSLAALGYAVDSASDEAAAAGPVDLSRYDLVVVELGLDKRTAWPDPDDTRPLAFEALPDALRQRLSGVLDAGGRLIVAGAHWASDTAAESDGASWLRQQMGIADVTEIETASGGRLSTPDDVPVASVATAYGPDAVALRRIDMLRPTAGARPVLRHASPTQVVGVSTGRTVALSVPLALVPDDAERTAILRIATQALGL
ncbi:MAG: hypothetical protein AAGK21_15165 [Bacteroidota bacterium]